MYVKPELLINKSPSELPQGVDPSQKEVSAGRWTRWERHQTQELFCADSNLLSSELVSVLYLFLILREHKATVKSNVE